MKIIFLDIDGVLATPKESWGTPIYEWDTVFAYPFNKKCVERFNDIILATNAQIVFSSAWRIEFNHETKLIKPLFEHNHIDRVPFDITPNIFFKKRADEIRRWLSENPKPEKFIILDDMDIQGFGDRFIQCKIEFGITEKIKNTAIERLN